MMFKSKIITSLSVAALLTAVPFSFGAGINATAKTTSKKVVEKKIPVQLLSMNDLHGYIDGNNKKDSVGTPVGGMASLAYNFEQEKAAFAKANKLKSTTSNSLSIHAGDTVGGSPAISSLLQDEPTMNILNAMNFSIGALGNHEFDEGLDEFQRIWKGKKPIKGVTQNYEFVKDYKQTTSKMEILSANVVDKKTKKLVKGFKPYTVKTIGGVKVGFIGIVTPRIKEVVLAQHTKDIDVVDPGQAVAKYTKELRKQGVKAIAVVAHSSVEVDKEANSSIETQENSRLTGDVIDMLKTANKLDPSNSIDVVFAGHNHGYANGTYKGVRVVEAYNYASAYSVVTGTLSSKTKDFMKTPAAKIKYNYTQTETTIMKNKVSKKVNGIIQETKGIVGKVMDQPIANMNAAKISRERVAYPLGGSPVGNLVTDGQLAFAKAKDASVDFAFTNSGGVRSDLDATASGDSFVISRGAAQGVQPFGNILKIVELTGAQVKSAINNQFTGGYGLEVSGLTYTYKDKAVVDVFVNGEKIDEAKTYKAVINDFLVGGGDQFPTFKEAKVIDDLGLDTDAFIQYITNLKTVDASSVVEPRLKEVQ